MNAKDFLRLGVPLGEATRRAGDFVSRFLLSGGDKARLEEELKAILADPARYRRTRFAGSWPGPLPALRRLRGPSRSSIVSGARGWSPRR